MEETRNIAHPIIHVESMIGIKGMTFVFDLLAQSQYFSYSLSIYSLHIDSFLIRGKQRCWS